MKILKFPSLTYNLSILLLVGFTLMSITPYYWQLSSIYALTGNIRMYQNSNYGISIEFPSNWTIDEEDYSPDDRVADVAYFKSPFESDSDKYSEQLAVRIENLEVLNLGLEKYLDDTINAYSSLKDFEVLDSETTNNFLAGNPAYRLTYTFTETMEEGNENNNDNDDNEVAVKVMEIAAIVGKKGYYVDYYAEPEKFDTYLSTIQNMTDSLIIDTSIISHQQGGLGGGNIIEPGTRQDSKISSHKVQSLTNLHKVKEV